MHRIGSLYELVENRPEGTSEQLNPRYRHYTMTNHISIQVESDEQYERFQQVREKYGVTWKGLLIQGTFHLEEQDTAIEEGHDRD
jgi:hypothetical protein